MIIPHRLYGRAVVELESGVVTRGGTEINVAMKRGVHVST